MALFYIYIFERYFKKKQDDYFASKLEILKQRQESGNGLCGGGCFGPLTVVSGIVGAERTLKYIFKKPQLIKKFVEYVTSYLIELAKMEENEGAQFFWIAEPLASLLKPDKFWEFSGVFLKEIFSSVKVPGFLHVCGKTINHTKYMENTGAEVLSIDYLTDIGQCIRMVDEDTVIMGNISPVLLKEGNVDEVISDVE